MVWGWYAGKGRIKKYVKKNMKREHVLYFLHSMNREVSVEELNAYDGTRLQALVFYEE